MKKRYTKKQITEAIAYWKKQLTESSIDKTDLENDLCSAAIDNVEPEMPEEVEDICREIVYNFVYNHSEQMLMEFADGYKDKDYIKNIEGEMSTQEAYDSQFAQYEHSDATSLYAACNGDIRSLQSGVKIVGASIEEDDYDMKMVEVEFKYQGKTYKGSDVWYGGNRANDDQDEFEHCSKSDLEEVIDWVQEDKDIAELPVDILNCIKGKYIKATTLLDILEMALPCGDSDGTEYVKII